MRLWHYKLIPILPNAMLVSQWRECIAIKRQWEKGTLKHRLVSYVNNYNRQYFLNYLYRVMDAMYDRKIKFQRRLKYERKTWIWSRRTKLAVSSQNTDKSLCERRSKG